jgi:ADP-ribosyl-[dinitrogen reductase] hydrolase
MAATDDQTALETLYPLLVGDDGLPRDNAALRLSESRPFGSGLEPAPGVVARAQGCLLGQLAGDALGSLVEFLSEAESRKAYPDGVHELAGGGPHHTIAGQPTDDSEMALMLARSIIRMGEYEPGEAAAAYARWFGSPPFDFGGTTAQALRPALEVLRHGESPGSVAAAARAAASTKSQANGALMRVSPLGIFAHALPPATAADLAGQDASLTHPHVVCRDANAVFVVALARAISAGGGPEEIYRVALDQAASADPSVHRCLEQAVTSPPSEFQDQQGWVLIALQNAFWQLLHASDFEAGVTDTVMRGGDTDTNAAIAGALLGAVHSVDAVPARWRDAILACRPEQGRPGVRQPRPRPFWPVDALELARQLASLGVTWATDDGQAMDDGRSVAPA